MLPPPLPPAAAAAGVAVDVVGASCGISVRFRDFFFINLEVGVGGGQVLRVAFHGFSSPPPPPWL